MYRIYTFIYVLLLTSFLFSKPLFAEIDFGDEKSTTLTQKAWVALDDKKYEDVLAYTKKNIELYSELAEKQQATLSSFPSRDEFRRYFALNDVATCYYIEYKALTALGEEQEAINRLDYVIFNFPFSQYADVSGKIYKLSELCEKEKSGKKVVVNTTPSSMAVSEEPTKKYDFGDHKSSTLTSGAWNFLQSKDVEGVKAFFQKCVDIYEDKALEQQSSLTNLPQGKKAEAYWALNDVATCYFILAEALRADGQTDEAKKYWQQVIDKFSFGQCFDMEGGWYWSIAATCQKRLDYVDSPYDFGDAKSSTLTSKAWQALEARDYEACEAYAKRCTRDFGKVAKKQQRSLTKLPKEDADKYWALNDVGTCYFILGENFRNQNKKSNAKKMYLKVVRNYKYAQCYDTGGWYWSIAEACEEKIEDLKSKYDFGTGSSSELTTKAWQALENKDYKALNAYTQKVFKKFEKEALKQQKALKKYASQEDAGKSWALNDVATCHFIRAKALEEQEKDREAKKAYKVIFKKYYFAQCFGDNNYWRVGEAAKEKLDTWGMNIDFGDYTSGGILVKGWEAFDKGKMKKAIIYAKKCISLYKKDAIKQQQSVNNYAKPGTEFGLYALNDVGTAYYMLGEIYYKKRDWDKAYENYQILVDNFGFSQCYDERGWFWKPAVAAQDKINQMSEKRFIKKTSNRATGRGKSGLKDDIKPLGHGGEPMWKQLKKLR